MDPLLVQSASGWSSHTTTRPRSSVMTPHFAYTESFEGGAVYCGISPGRGKFVAVQEIALAPCVVFAVVKDRLKRNIVIDFQSQSLVHTISNALGTYSGPGSPGSPLPDLRALLDSYDSLKQHLELLQSHIPGHPETQEFRLLVEDFLMDSAVFEGLGLEQPDRPYVLSQAQLRDFHERNLDTGLDALDDCFRLGIIPFDMNDDDLNALTKRYAQIALSGDSVTPNGLLVPKTRPRNFGAHHDPVFSSGGAEHEPPGSYQSFSNLALRIKGPEAGGPLPRVFNTPPNPLPATVDSVDRFFKVGSPLRSGPAHERYASDDSTVGLSTGGFTSLSALENGNMSVGLGNSMPPPRPRANSFHNGREAIDPSLNMQLDDGFGQYVTSRSEGTPEKDIDLLAWETESEPVFFGARANSALPVASLPIPTFHGVTSTSQNYDLDIPMREKQSHHLLRQRLGRNLIGSLTSLCKSVRDAIGESGAGSLESSISSRFSSFMGVWSRGIGVFRQIIDNHPPRGLLEVLDCLVVASAMCTAIASNKDQDDGSMYFEFINDMGRWRSTLDPAEHPLFDRIALALWLSVSFGDPMSERTDKDNLAKFHELIQDLVTLGKEETRAQTHSVPYASRLSTIQREYVSKQDEQSQSEAISGPVSIPIPGGGARKRVFDESLDMEPDLEDDFSISDVFDVDLFLSQSVGDDAAAPEVVDLGWNDILSTTVLLLASTAFSAFLTLATVIHRDFDAESILAVWRRPRSYSRSCDIVGHFIESVSGRQGGFRGIPLHRERSLDQDIKRLSLSTMSAPSTGHMWPPSTWANQTPSSLRMRARASAAPSALHSTAMDLSHSLGAVPHPKRLRCLSTSCQKTFSSVSNRNKHMREGCQHREKTGYRCRNEHCPKVLTTKWYRNTHETERCRHRGVTGQVAGDKGG